MPALREIFARFGVAFETGPLAKGEAQIKRVTDALGVFGVSLGGAAIVYGIRQFVNGIKEAGDELGDTSQLLGVQTGDLQAWRHAGELAGVGAQDLTRSLNHLQRVMGDAQGGNAAARETFRRLGVDVVGADGQIRRLGDFLPELADRIQGIASPAERAATLNRLMGESGARLGPLLSGGAEGLAAMRAEFEALGGGLSEEAIEAASRLADAQQRLSVSVDGLRSRIGLFLLPLLERLTGALTDLLSNRRKLESLQAALAAVAVVISVRLLPAMAALIARSAPLIASWAPIIAMGTILYLVIEDIKTALEGGDSLFGQWTDAINDFTEANADADGVLGAVARTWRGLIDLMEEGFAIADAIVHLDPSRITARRESERNRAAGNRRGFGSVGVDAQGNVVPIARAAARGDQGGGVTVVQDNRQTITGDSPAEIARAVERANARSHRRAIEALEGRTP